LGPYTPPALQLRGLRRGRDWTIQVDFPPPARRAERAKHRLRRPHHGRFPEPRSCYWPLPRYQPHQLGTGTNPFTRHPASPPAPSRPSTRSRRDAPSWASAAATPRWPTSASRLRRSRSSKTTSGGCRATSRRRSPPKKAATSCARLANQPTASRQNGSPAGNEDPLDVAATGGRSAAAARTPTASPRRRRRPPASLGHRDPRAAPGNAGLAPDMPRRLREQGGPRRPGWPPPGEGVSLFARFSAMHGAPSYPRRRVMEGIHDATT
jgi:hypothetical protein